VDTYDFACELPSSVPPAGEDGSPEGQASHVQRTQVSNSVLARGLGGVPASRTGGSVHSAQGTFTSGAGDLP